MHSNIIVERNHWEINNSDNTHLESDKDIFLRIHSYSSDNKILFNWVSFQELSLLYLCRFPQPQQEMRRLQRWTGQKASYFELLETKRMSAQLLNTLPCHKGPKKVTEILFLESLTFDLSDSCNLSSFQMCLRASTATLKLWLKSCIISPSSQLPLC